jgi:hypothetical protein
MTLSTVRPGARLGRGPALFAILYLPTFLIAIVIYYCASASRSYSVRC